MSVPLLRRVAATGTLPVQLVCDHASNRIPDRLKQLGLSADDLARHIAWDIGALELSERLADRLGLGLVAAGFSRLVIDCNRHLDDVSSIVERSDGTLVPGNHQLTAADREWRVRQIFDPYHAAIEQEIGRLERQAVAPALIAIHSFTPVMGGMTRPWQCGILWDRDPRIAEPLMAALRRIDGLTVGDNQPYSGQHPADYTIERHAELHGRPHVCIEIRQDQLLTAAGQTLWCDRLAAALGPILGDRSLYRACTPYQPARQAQKG